MVIGSWHGVLFPRNVWPLGCILAIDLQPVRGAGISIRQDGFNGAFRLAHAAVDAFIRVNDEHVLAFIKTVDWADFDAVSILAHNAIFCNDVRHSLSPMLCTAMPRRALFICQFGSLDPPNRHDSRVQVLSPNVAYC